MSLNNVKAPRRILEMRLLLGLAILVVWELAGRTYGHDWSSLPSLIGARLFQWVQGDLLMHVSVTLMELVIGFAIGSTGGILAGLLLGRSPVGAAICRPFIVAAYSVPMVTLAPLLILWFGLDLAPKIVLVSLVVFFLLFFNTFTGVQTVDADLVATLRLMGANPREQFQKVVAPASLVWIVSGLKLALPYALVAATVSEMLASRRGIGSLVAKAAQQFDMTALYSALFVLMILGVLIASGAIRMENYLLRWRNVQA